MSGRHETRLRPSRYHSQSPFVFFLYGHTGLSASNQRITDTGKTPRREFFWERKWRFVGHVFLSLSPSNNGSAWDFSVVLFCALYHVFPQDTLDNLASLGNTVLHFFSILYFLFILR